MSNHELKAWLGNTEEATDDSGEDGHPARGWIPAASGQAQSYVGR